MVVHVPASKITVGMQLVGLYDEITEVRSVTAKGLLVTLVERSADGQNWVRILRKDLLVKLLVL